MLWEHNQITLSESQIVTRYSVANLGYTRAKRKVMTVWAHVFLFIILFDRFFHSLGVSCFARTSRSEFCTFQQLRFADVLPHLPYSPDLPPCDFLTLQSWYSPLWFSETEGTSRAADIRWDRAIEGPLWARNAATRAMLELLREEKWELCREGICLK